MFWVVVFLVLALAGLAVLIAYGVWLAHRTADLLSELGVLADRAGQLADLLGRIEAPVPAEAGPGRSEPGAATAL